MKSRSAETGWNPWGMLPHLLPQRSLYLCPGGRFSTSEITRLNLRRDLFTQLPSVVATPDSSVLHPTPMQVVLRQETPKSELKSAPEGFEVPWIDQLVPFHFSARVWDDSRN